MAGALATCDMATVIEGVRAAHGWSQGDLARAIDYSQSWVSRVVNGQQSLTISQVHDLARRLDIPLHLLRFGGTAPQARPAEKGVDTTRRRDFGRAVAAGALLTATTGAAPAPVASDPCPDTVNETTAHSLRAITGGQRRMDATSPSRHLLPSAVAHVHLAEHMRGQSHGTPFHGELSAAASEASGFAAWLHADRGDMGSARAHYRTAVTRARQADMRLLDVYMLGSLAAFETDTAEDHHLGLGLVQEAERVLGPAARSANTDPPWPWVFAFDEAKVAGYRARVGVRLRQPHDARRAFSEAFAPHGGNPKQTAVLQVELASAHAEAGDVDEAFRLVNEALNTGVRYESERIIGRVRAFRRRYSGTRARCAAALDDRLLSLVRGAAAQG
ncbi:helix-turn-helix transcriptional regulator [Nocardiopsis dassonvillei]|uniref:helix-turn-helix domain-containing protein n=1 Tax=Nocardiopsis dassonvillei TaxID=2014 RepID=UPI00200D9B95|nr:helix-turn-helix transcriptional regulator [Nocardiopsis dassonvillei]MCK9868291.1 helix-turn-helix transcriptional regulator [Nocardiopsis dassonvillei]